MLCFCNSADLLDIKIQMSKIIPCYLSKYGFSF